MKNRRRVIFGIFVIFISAVLYYGNTAIQTTIITVECDDIPESFNGMTIVHISDLHNYEFGKNQIRLIYKVKKAEPDIIAVTGDLVDSRRTDIDIAMEFMEQAVKIAPVYYVTGNHESRIEEFEDLENRLADCGVITLRDRKAEIEAGGDRISILGIDDPTFGNKDVQEKLESLISEDDNYKILLSHRPELFDTYCEAGVELVLSGHAHGGQIRLPFLGGIAAPNQGFYPKYTEGLYSDGSTSMVVSRGLGNSIIPLRINNRPEIVVIKLEKQ